MLTGQKAARDEPKGKSIDLGLVSLQGSTASPIYQLAKDEQIIFF